MKLLLDIGNSSVNWALEQHAKFILNGAFSYDKSNIQQDLEENLLLSEKPLDVLVSNVAGDKIFHEVSAWASNRWGLTIWAPGVEASFKELKNAYNNTQQMGIDRWLAMLACWETYHTAIVLVGCGTAITIDLINVEGMHLGGYIIPGIELMQIALVNETEQINVDIQKQASIDYAKDTQTAINNGAFIAAVSMIERVATNFSTEQQYEPRYIISGGMGELIKPLLKYPFVYEPGLVLSGLSIIHQNDI